MFNRLTPNAVSQSEELCSSPHLLLHLDEDGSPVHVDQFRRLNGTVSRLLSELYTLKCSSVKEEAEVFLSSSVDKTEVCLSLLMRFSATAYPIESGEEKMQVVPDRTSNILPRPEPSLLNCRLLPYCFAMAQDKELTEKAKEIIMSRDGKEMTKEEREMMAVWNGMVINT